MAIDPISTVFSNGKQVSAAEMNGLVTTINALIAANNATQSLLETISKSELLVIARKSVNQSFVGNGVANTITQWITTLNKNNIFNATTGIATVKESGTYTIVGKTLISADNADAPRSKLTISANGQEVALSEDTVFQQQTFIVQNYRRNHDVNATVTLNINAPVLLFAQVWGATQANIFADTNTVIKIYREIA